MAFLDTTVITIVILRILQPHLTGLTVFDIFDITCILTNHVAVLFFNHT